MRAARWPRLEWLKFWGILLGKEELAEQEFARQVERLAPLTGAGFHRQALCLFLHHGQQPCQCAAAKTMWPR